MGLSMSLGGSSDYDGFLTFFISTYPIFVGIFPISFLLVLTMLYMLNWFLAGSCLNLLVYNLNQKSTILWSIKVSNSQK